MIHLKKKIELPNIPMLKKPVIAINIDFKKKKEHLIIGDFDNINSFLRGQKDVEIIFEKIRSIGSFLFDVITDADYFSDLMACFSDTTKEKYFINLKIVEELYGAENPLLKYVGLQLWDEYSRILKADKERTRITPSDKD